MVLNKQVYESALGHQGRSADSLDSFEYGKLSQVLRDFGYNPEAEHGDLVEWLQAKLSAAREGERRFSLLANILNDISAAAHRAGYTGAEDLGAWIEQLAAEKRKMAETAEANLKVAYWLIDRASK